jgi:hypothetical protein
MSLLPEIVALRQLATAMDWEIIGLEDDAIKIAIFPRVILSVKAEKDPFDATFPPLWSVDVRLPADALVINPLLFVISLAKVLSRLPFVIDGGAP